MGYIYFVYGTNKMVNAFTHLPFTASMTMVFVAGVAGNVHIHTHSSITIFALLTNSQTIMIQSSFLGLFLSRLLFSISLEKLLMIILSLWNKACHIRFTLNVWMYVRNGVYMMCFGIIQYECVYMSHKRPIERVVFVSCT